MTHFKGLVPGKRSRPHHDPYPGNELLNNKIIFYNNCYENILVYSHSPVGTSLYQRGLNIVCANAVYNPLFKGQYSSRIVLWKEDYILLQRFITHFLWKKGVPGAKPLENSSPPARRQPGRGVVYHPLFEVLQN